MPTEPPAGGSIARNAASLLASRGAAAVVSFAFGILIARKLGVAEFGLYSILMAIYTLLSIFVHLGMESLLIREIARARQEAGRYFRAAVMVKAGSAGLCLAMLALAAALLPRARPLALPLVLLGIILIVDAVSDAIAAVFQAHERFTEPAMLGLAGGVLFAATGSSLLLAGGRTTSLVAGLLAAKLIQVAAGGMLLGRRLGAALAGSSPVTIGFSAGLLAAALPFFLSKLFAVLYLRVDVLMLGGLAGEAPVGLYAAATKFVNVSSAAAAALAAALFPVMASAAAHDMERFHALFRDSLRIMLVTGTLISAVVWIAAEEILSLVFGTPYAAGAPAARLLGWSIVVLFMNLIFSNALLSLDRERYAVWVGGLALAVNVGLNLLLIPAFLERGAAAATLASEAAVAAAYAAALLRAGLVRVDPSQAGRFLLAAAALLAPMLILGSRHAAAGVAAGAALYAAALVGLRVLTAGDLARVRTLFVSPGGAG